MAGLLVALLASSSVVLAAGLGWLVWRTRRDFVTTHGAFRCKVRLRSADLPGITATWSRTSQHAMWVHTVLVIRSGLLRSRIQHLSARTAEGLVELNPGNPRGLGRLRGLGKLRGLGPHPVSMTVQLDDRQEIELAAAEQDRMLLVGPFVVLAAGLPDETAPGSR